MNRTLKAFCLPVGVPLLFLVVWQALAVALGNEIILPTVGQAAAPLLHPFDDLISMGSMLDNICISLLRVLAGYLTAACIAIPLGIAMGYSRNLSDLLSGFLGLFRSIPPLAWVPLVLAWFGVSSFATLLNPPIGPFYGYLHNIKFSMLFIICIGGFYPILTSTIHGVRVVPAALLDAARVLGADEGDIFRKVLLPAAAPDIVTGLRIGLGVSWMCLVSAEMLPGSLSGAGYLITHAYTVGRTDVVMAGMASIGLIGAGMDRLFRLFEERRFIWKRLTR